MRAVIVAYTLRDGTRGRLHMLSRSTADAVLRALELFGERLRAASVRTPH